MLIPQRKISELVARYQLEPSLIDIYVEGEFDKRVLTWFIGESGEKRNIQIITSDTIDVSEELLKKYSLNLNSSRSKIIALAKELCTNVPNAKILCVVDKDYDGYFQHPDYKEPNLVFTDYNSLDLYWLTKKIWKKIMLLSFGYSEKESSVVFSHLVSILQDVFLMRLTNESLKLGLTLDGFCKPKYINLDTFEFNINSFLNSVLTTAGKAPYYDTFLEKMEFFKNKFSSDTGNNIRGHDFFALLYYYLKKKKQHIKIGDANSFQVVFMGCIELQDLMCTVLFRRISELIELS